MSYYNINNNISHELWVGQSTWDVLGIFIIRPTNENQQNLKNYLVVKIKYQF